VKCHLRLRVEAGTAAVETGTFASKHLERLAPDADR